MTNDELKAAIREAGGIVHSDGNIFFTNAELFLAAARAAVLDGNAFGYWHQGATEEESDFFKADDFGNVACPTCITLYAGSPTPTHQG